MDKLLIRSYRREDERDVINLWIKCNLVVSTNNPQKDIERKLRVNPELFLVGHINDTLVATCMAADPPFNDDTISETSSNGKLPWQNPY